MKSRPCAARWRRETSSAWKLVLPLKFVVSLTLANCGNAVKYPVTPRVARYVWPLLKGLGEAKPSPVTPAIAAAVALDARRSVLPLPKPQVEGPQGVTALPFRL